MVASSQINRNIVNDRIGKDHVITEERLVDITDNSGVKDGCINFLKLLYSIYDHKYFH